MGQPRESTSSVSVLTICGTADGLIPYDGGSSPVFGGDDNFQLMSNDNSNKVWANHNKCSLDPTMVTVSSSMGSHAIHYTYENCDACKHVEHYMVVGGGHNSGGAELDGKDSSTIVFDFIKKCEEGQSAPVANPVPSPVASPVANPIANPVANPVPSPVAAPVANPVDPPTICEDDPNWRGKHSDQHDCAWVNAKPQMRCNAEDTNGVPAREACHVACNQC